MAAVAGTKDRYSFSNLPKTKEKDDSPSKRDKKQEMPPAPFTRKSMRIKTANLTKELAAMNAAQAQPLRGSGPAAADEAAGPTQPPPPPTCLDMVKKDLRCCLAILRSPLMIMLVFVPTGLCAKSMGLSVAWIFSLNFLAIMPLASLLGASTEALAEHTGQLIGGLLNATFGNAVEMIMCVQAVRAGLVRVVQGNLLGSILSNLLLVLGMSLFSSGVIRKDQTFNAAGASANMSCQILASISIVMPTMYKNVTGANPHNTLMISRICSLFTMIVYFMFLFFQLGTHADLFEDSAEAETKAEDAEEAEAGTSSQPIKKEPTQHQEPEEEEEVMTPFSATILLAASTIVVAMCSEYLVDSIEDVSDSCGVPKAFIGVILLPIVGNAAEHATAVTSAMKGLMDLALGVAVGSSTQIALFVVPCSVIFGWVYDKPMSLDFRNFDATCMMLSVFLTSQVLQHGHSNWLHGAMLMCTYSLIAIISWFIPEDT
eukprot:TRINITY_DN17796_c0_g1_i1.p1 TRINITY_DN17796_c0_g1~~TRINITY_DN17796_c0_g1_i1.p1  ORF type:complete len:486 (+),score=136.38 TRINITY_DN17796_c0_g1_i1:159-1616(+)